MIALRLPPVLQTEMRSHVANLEMEQFENAPVPRLESTNKLKVGAVGIFGVLFMAVANAAPITAMTGNVPIATAYGNGVFSPAGYLVATVVLTLFTVGYVAMARHITTAGAFYGFVSHGLGQIWGMATGLMATMAYIVFEGSLIGIFAYFGNNALETWFSINVNWLIIAVVGIVLVAIFGYYDINIAAALLGFFLVCEVILLAALSLSVLFKGGGPDGLMLSSINPANAFKSLPEGGGYGIQMGGSALPAGAAAIGLFFAFWSWVGLRDDRRVRRGVPQPPADRAPGDAHRGGRPRPVLHVRLVDGHRRERRQAVDRHGGQQLDRHVHRAGEGEPRRRRGSPTCTCS